MVKVLWFFKRAEGLTLSEFREWWTGDYARHIRIDQAPHLGGYVVNVREDLDQLPGKPEAQTGDEPEFDGVAEQWFASEQDFVAVYGKHDRPARAEALAHVSRMERLIVREWEF